MRSKFGRLTTTRCSRVHTFGAVVPGSRRRWGLLSAGVRFRFLLQVRLQRTRAHLQWATLATLADQPVLGNARRWLHRMGTTNHAALLLQIDFPGCLFLLQPVQLGPLFALASDHVVAVHYDRNGHQQGQSCASGSPQHGRTHEHHGSPLASRWSVRSLQIFN
uniref:(northern house mosquito) hypothetical protein n=1 Tax=Culex pipiens TaxID=7175 RepID=A0A8D8EVX4_CULPI